MHPVVSASVAGPPTRMAYESDRSAQRKDWRWNSRLAMNIRRSLE